MNNNELAEKMKVVLASCFALYLKSHSYHWNITGSNFPQLHTLFGDQYEELHDAIDVTAEVIRTLEVFVPGSFGELTALSVVESSSGVPADQKMVETLVADHQKIIDLLTETLSIANRVNAQGVANHLGDRIEAHEKHQWMLRSTAKQITGVNDMSDDLLQILKNAGLVQIPYTAS